MKHIHYKTGIAALAFISMFATACMKTETPPGTASLTVINAVVGSQPLVMNFGDDRLQSLYKNANKLSYGTFSSGVNVLKSYTGEQRLKLYQMPDTTDKSNPFYDVKFNLPLGSMKSLYLVGTLAQHDTLLMDEHFPYHSASDSVTSIRFANLVAGSAPYSVNIKGAANGSLVASLPFKGVSGFIHLPATSAVSSYIFEIRDVATGTLIVSFTASGINLKGSGLSFNKYMFKSNTLAIIGTPGGTGTAIIKTLLIANTF